MRCAKSVTGSTLDWVRVVARRELIAMAMFGSQTHESSRWPTNSNFHRHSPSQTGKAISIARAFHFFATNGVGIKVTQDGGRSATRCASDTPKIDQNRREFGKFADWDLGTCESRKNGNGRREHSRRFCSETAFRRRCLPTHDNSRFTLVALRSTRGDPRTERISPPGTASQPRKHGNPISNASLLVCA